MTQPRSSPPGVLQRFRRDRAGNVAMLFALSLPMVVGGSAFAVETSYWYLRDRQLQAAADAAAYAGALENRAGSKLDRIRTVATAEAGKNGFVPASGSIEVFSAPASGPNVGNQRAVEVRLSRAEKRFLTGLFSNDEVTARARSVALFVDQGRACIVALSPTAGRAAEFTGNSNLTLAGCSVLANSIAGDAVYVGGAGRVTTPCMYAVGGADVGRGATLTECSAPVIDAPVMADPYRDLVEPAASSCTRTNQSVGTKQKVTLNPGTYCRGITVRGDVTFNPGVYVVDGGDLRFGAQASAVGSGVTFVFRNGAGFDSNGGSKLTLSAPTTAAGSNPYKGVLFFGARNNTGSIKINGNSSSRLTGTIYFPNQDIEYRGNFSGKNGCTHVVGNTVSWSGNTRLEINCEAEGMTAPPAQQFVRLVE
jgi:hypothetical protein